MSTTERQSTSQAIEALYRAILDSARQQAQARLDEAERAVEELERETESAAQGTREQIMGAARKEAELDRRRVVSAAELEAQHAMLAKREEFISQVFDEVQKRLSDLQRSDDYRQVLSGLMVEAARALGSGQLTVFASESDMKLLDDGFLAQIAERVGPDTKLQRSESPADIQGGVILERADGTMRYDNTFSARLGRSKTELRNRVYRILIGAD